MSLGTIIQIGKALRKSKDPMKHFRYVCEVPKETDDRHIICLTIHKTLSIIFVLIMLECLQK